MNVKAGVVSLLCGALVFGSSMEVAEGAQRSRNRSSRTRRTQAVRMDSTTALKHLRGRQFDLVFLPTMIEHHMQGIKMSEMARDFGKNDEMRELSQKIIDTQRQEVAEMTAMSRQRYRRWPNEATRKKVRQENLPMMTTFRMDCRRGCDDVYPTQMRQHHETGIMMAQLARSKASHPSLMKLAARMEQGMKEDMDLLNNLSR